MENDQSAVSPKGLLILMQISGAVQVLVGLTLWSGHGFALRGLHMANGVLFVVLLWSIAIFALARRHRAGLAFFAILWGLVIPILGFTQQGILIGDYHWVIRVLHLVVSVAAMPMANLLAKRNLPA
ncbi:MAG: hypothetical protein ABJE10_09830 [bacterium]